MCDVRYILFEILDKRKYADPVRDHLETVLLHHTLYTMQKTDHTITVP